MVRHVFTIFFAFMILQGFVLTHDCSSAAKKTPQTLEGSKKAGATVKTRYFSLVIPKDWEMPEPIHEMPGGLSAMFASRGGELAVTINVLETNLSAKELAERTVENMKKSGLVPTAPQQVKGMWRIGIKGKVEGEAWFGSSGGLNSATVLLGPDPAKVNILLKALKPVKSGLFPTAIGK